MNIFKELKLYAKLNKSRGYEKPLNKMTYSELCRRTAELYEDAFEGDDDTY